MEEETKRIEWCVCVCVHERDEERMCECIFILGVWHEKRHKKRLKYKEGKKNIKK